MLLGGIVPVVTQPAPLRIVSATPSGELRSPSDAGQIRVVFSEPMVPLGAIPQGAPSWAHLTPAVPGTFYWSGTRTLIFSPAPSTPLPSATRFTLRIDASAVSTAGRTLDGPYELTFATPAVRLDRVAWRRKSGRFDSPALITLTFNQQVRPEDVLVHTRVAFTPYQAQTPGLSDEARAYLRRTNPAGLAAFDRKVAAVASVTRRAGPVAIRLAAPSTDERADRDPKSVVVETVETPPPDAKLTITADAVPSLQGPLTRAAESKTVQLEPTFFVRGTRCSSECNPGFRNSLRFTRPVALDAASSAASVVDLGPQSSGRVLPGPSDAVADDHGASLEFDFRTLGLPLQRPLGRARILVAADLTAADGQRLGYPWVSFVETDAATSFVGFDGSVWEAANGPAIPLYVRNVTAIRQFAAPIGPSDVVPWLLARERLTDAPSLPAPNVRRTLKHLPQVVQAQPIDIRAWLSQGGTGILRLGVAPSEFPARATVLGANDPSPLAQVVGEARDTLIQVTNLGITVKRGPRSIVVFVTRLDDASPVSGAAVAIVGADNRERWRGTTDTEGIALAPALSLLPGNDYGLSFVVTAQKGGDVAFVASSWSEGRFDYHEESDETSALRASVFSDRGVYRQGEDVHLKVIAREDTLQGIRSLAEGTPIAVVIRDARYQQVASTSLTVNRWSSAEWIWRVPPDARLDDYRVEVRRPGSDEPGERSGHFLVAAFRPPDFRVDVVLAGTPIAGEPLRGEVAASYLFGAPLRGRTATWRVTRDAVRSVPPALRERYPEASYEVGYDPERAHEALAQSTGADLNEQGRLVVDLASKRAGDAAATYTFTATAQTPAGIVIGNRAQFLVHPAAVYVAMSRPPLFVDRSKGLSVGVAAVDLAGQTAADLPITVSLVRESWVRDETSSRTGSAWRRRELPAGEWTVRSPGKGEARVEIPVLEGGSYVVRAVGEDAAGRRTRTEARFYAIGSGVTSWHSEDESVPLVPERTTWKPGESARILIQSPWPRATALLTVEREGVLRQRVVQINSTQDTVDVPITEGDVPNVYISVVLVKGRTPAAPGERNDESGPAYRTGTTVLGIDDASKRLRVTVNTDRPEYRPRQPLQVAVNISDPAGVPIPAEVTLWAVDYGLLSLSGYKLPDVVQAIYRTKVLTVTTLDNRARLMKRAQALSPSLMVEGGILGRVAEASAIELSAAAPPAPPPAHPPAVEAGQSAGDEIRSDFRPLVVWLGSATAGPDGQVTTTATFPDSLTTYRILAVAADDAARFGSGEREVRVTKPLTLLPALPRFMAAGDRASFGAVVTNTGSAAGDALVTMESLDPQGLQFGTARQTVRLAPGANESVAFAAQALRPGVSRVRMTVTLGADKDGFEVPLTITAPIQREITAAYGMTTATATERVVIPKAAFAGSGGLTVDLASTAMVGLSESARYLDQYPYECTEQKASRALALLLAADLGSAFTLSGIAPADYRQAAVQALKSLHQAQCSDGGFALWPGQCGNQSAYLTAYVLHVLNVAAASGFDVDQSVVRSALDELDRSRSSQPPEEWRAVWALSEALTVKVLAAYGRKPAKRIDTLAGMADQLPIAALSYLADAMASVKDTSPRARDVDRRIANALRVDGDRAHVEEADDDALSWVWNTNVTSTATVLDGLVRRGGDAPLTASLARWLVAARTDSRWSTTHENAIALEALVNYYRKVEGEEPRLTATVTMAGAEVGSATFDGRSTASQQVHLSMPELLKVTAASDTGSRELSVSRTGTGRVYYTARLETIGPESPDAVDRGFHVARRYERQLLDGRSGSQTSFQKGDVIRVTVAVTLRSEGRYVILTDPIPAGVEPVDTNLQTTPDLDEAAAQNDRSAELHWWHRGGFDHIEKHDDRVVAAATRLAPGRHEFSYLVRATTAGTFRTAGARLEAMYAPESMGRSETVVVTVK